MSHAEVAALLATELGKAVSHQTLSRESWRDELLALAHRQPGGALNQDMAHHISTLGAALARPGTSSMPRPDAAALARLTGREPLRFEQYLRQERGRFMGHAAVSTSA